MYEKYVLRGRMCERLRKFGCVWLTSSHGQTASVVCQKLGTESAKKQLAKAAPKIIEKSEG